MTINDFYVAIQGILLQAQEDTDWSINYIQRNAEMAIDEWLEENNEEDED